MYTVEDVLAFIEQLMNSPMEATAAEPTKGRTSLDYAAGIMQKLQGASSPEQAAAMLVGSMGAVVRAMEIVDQTGCSEFKALQQAAEELQGNPKLTAQKEREGRRIGEQILRMEDTRSKRKRLPAPAGVEEAEFVEVKPKRRLASIRLLPR
jgi:hypothetical protein